MDVGVHRNGQYSTDFGLRHASQTRNQTMAILRSLRALVVEAMSMTPNLNDEIMREIRESVQTKIKDLNNLAWSIQHAYPVDLIGEPPEEIRKFAAFDRDHVQMRFPKAGKQIIHWLAGTITCRRKLFRLYKQQRPNDTQVFDTSQEYAPCVMPHATSTTNRIVGYLPMPPQG
ncbi:hypothetical protein AJ79_07771 [Helicocarpus griseus UAMH5409]|uniref:Uncharacterized protein n=1 Tax=Helicocarpus griseus UAMH5409 TaxID=1447875 RepID=A0A2B7WZB6_9EURO|nr:hypothetical protein AJ79_07771 [Helicocarpus griseus UAMH5409]